VGDISARMSCCGPGLLLLDSELRDKAGDNVAFLDEAKVSEEDTELPPRIAASFKPQELYAAFFSPGAFASGCPLFAAACSI
jgi:hypothetical protein